MELIEILDIIEEGFSDSTISLIEQGHYNSAGLEMKNLYHALLLGEFGRQVSNLHSGISLIVYTKSLADSLSRGEKNESALGYFRAYLAQTRLSAKTGNTFS